MLIGYGRVSTLDQNIQLQNDALERAGCKRIFIEKASGASRDRPQLAAALDYLRPGDTLVVWKLDRLARSLSHLIETAGDLKARGIGLRSLTESIDTSTAGGELVFHIFGAMAQFERSLIRERVAAGLAAAKARGISPGRRRQFSDENVAQAKALIASGHTPASVARSFKVSVSTLYRHIPAAAQERV